MSPESNASRTWGPPYHALVTSSAHGDSPAAPRAPLAGAAASSFERAHMLHRLGSERFDVLVIGGGITGVGVALDAASRGLSTALVEADDFASGTSSKSSKLVHGGLRYLQQGDVRLVYQALRERKRLRHNAPHLVKILPFLLPILTKDGLLPRRVARALGTAMWMYDLTGGWRIGKFHKRLKADAAHAHVPTMDREKIAGGYLYYDATVDDARLVLNVAQTAAAHGAAVANRCRVVGLEHSADGTVCGASVDTGAGVIAVSASVVVNATGVWADDIRALEDGIDPDSIRPAKGVHITVPWSKVRNDIAAVIPVPGEKRSPVRGAVGREAGRHVRAHLHRHHRHRLHRPSRRPAVHRGRHRLRARRGQRGDHHDGDAGRHHRRVGGSAPPRAQRRERAHRRPVPPAPRLDWARRGHRHQRRQAHDVPRDGRGHRRRGRVHPRPARQVPHEVAAPPRCRGVPRRRPRVA